ncbi:MAG: YbaB/EbfC family nucleoid-associated protein [bacterium]
MGMFDQVKQAMQMRKDAKRIQAEIEAITCEYSNGGITCVVRGDFTLVSLKITDEALVEVKAGKKDRFETMLKTVVDAALKKAKAQTQEAMGKMMQNGEMGSMMGG